MFPLSQDVEFIAFVKKRKYTHQNSAYRTRRPREKPTRKVDIQKNSD
jgi:hypothetical protein